MPRKPILPAVPLKFRDLLDGVLQVKPPKPEKTRKATKKRKGR